MKRETKRKLFLLILVCCGITICFWFKPAIAENQLAPIKDALSRSLCYGVYWRGADHKLEANLKLEVKLEGEKFFVWINDLEITKANHMAGFYIGKIKNGQGAIINGEAYSINLTPPVPGYSKNRPLFETGHVIKDTLTIPTDCTPKYDPASPRKERMLQTIVNSMKDTFSRWVKTDIAKFPRELTLIIADFNIDYPETYVLVEPMNEFFRVTLHDPQNYDKDEEEYMFGEEHRMPKSIQEKVRKHGIIRKIVLDP
jgi:hypothetical protein